MDVINIIILSIIQGITEFLPISSSSHLILVSELTNYPDQGLGFDIALHAGSLLAILIYYRNEIQKIISFSPIGVSYLKLVVLASIPLPIFGLILVDYISLHMRNIETIAVMTIFFALVLYFADFNRKEDKNFINCSLGIVVFIGLMQTLALVPGVSRSGIVISSALIAGFSRSDSIKIALLLSIPAIFMASTYQAIKIIELGNIILVKEYIYGFILSFAFSYITIKYFIKTINMVTFTPYVIYRIILGSILLAML